MRKIYKVVEVCQRILTFAWYFGILAIYIFALIQALSLELTTAVGVVLVLWPLVLVLSVRMERETLLSTIPVLQTQKIDGWGMLSFPADWQVEGKDVLVFKESENVPCAVVFRKEQLGAEFTLNLPDNTPFKVKLPNSIQQNAGVALRCQYTVGQRKRIGYCSTARHMGEYYVCIVFSGKYTGAYIAEHFFEGICSEL